MISMAGVLQETGNCLPWVQPRFFVRSVLFIFLVFRGFFCFFALFLLVFCFLFFVFFFFVYMLFLMYPVLPVSLACSFVIAPSVFANVYLDICQRKQRLKTKD